MYQPDVPGPDSAGSGPPSRLPPHLENNTSWTANTEPTEQRRCHTTHSRRELTLMKERGKTQKKDVTDPLSEEQVYRGGMKVLRVSPGSQSPHRSLGFLDQMKAPLIRAKTKQ